MLLDIGLPLKRSKYKKPEAHQIKLELPFKRFHYLSQYQQLNEFVRSLMGMLHTWMLLLLLRQKPGLPKTISRTETQKLPYAVMKIQYYNTVILTFVVDTK